MFPWQLPAVSHKWRTRLETFFFSGNLSPKSTKESLAKYLGLDATPYLRSSSWVELPLDQSGKSLGFAYVSVPTHLGTHMVDLNNTKYMEKRIVVQPVYGKGSQPSMYSGPNVLVPFDVGNYASGMWPRPGNIRNRRYGGHPISYEQVSIPVEKKLNLIDVAINLTNKMWVYFISCCIHIVVKSSCFWYIVVWGL